MHNPNYLDLIAAMIRKNPSITVREIASKLQFSDSKSVYYWFEKNNLSGLNEFKRIVLSSDNYQKDANLIIDGQPHYLVPIPLYGWDPKEKSPLGEWYYLHNEPHASGLFALRLSTEEFSPWFTNGDILVISKEPSSKQSEWVLLQSDSHFQIAKLINNKPVHPLTFKNYPTSFKERGILLAQFRGHIA